MILRWGYGFQCCGGSMTNIFIHFSRFCNQPKHIWCSREAITGTKENHCYGQGQEPILTIQNISLLNFRHHGPKYVLETPGAQVKLNTWNREVVNSCRRLTMICQRLGSSRLHPQAHLLHSPHWRKAGIRNDPFSRRCGQTSIFDMYSNSMLFIIWRRHC